MGYGKPYADRDMSRLRSAVAAFAGYGFVVIDGGRFSDLPALLKKRRLFARSLFLDTADVAVQAAGPWLIKLAQSTEASDQVFSILEELSEAVFWCCRDGEAVLWRHLRGLAMVQIPRWAVRAPLASLQSGADEGDETVFFRHFDARVLGALLPVLDASQFARVLGPASEIAFVATDFGGLRKLVADPYWPRRSVGILTIRAEQIEALNERRLGASHRRIAGYLRSVAPDDVGAASDADLLRHVQISDETGRHLGIESEAGHCRWSLLMLLTNGQILKHRQACTFIARGPSPPDRQVETLITLAAESLRRDVIRRGGVPT